MGFKEQPAHADIFGLAIDDSLADESRVCSVNDREPERNGHAHPGGFPSLHGQPFVVNGDGHVPIAGGGDVDDLSLPIIDNSLLIPKFDSNFLSFLKEILRGGSGKLQPDFSRGTGDDRSSQSLLGRSLNGYRRAFLRVTTEVSSVLLNHSPCRRFCRFVSIVLVLMLSQRAAEVGVSSQWVRAVPAEVLLQGIPIGAASDPEWAWRPDPDETLLSSQSRPHLVQI